MTAERPTPTIEMRGITRRFPGVIANERVDFSLRPGEIHALLGENGAGKSTLVNILAGVQAPDEGTILIDAVPARFSGPQEAIARGIGMVHQHFMLVPTLSVTENIILGAEPSRAGILDLDRSRSDVRALSTRFGLAVDPDALVRDLPVGVQQRVEILKTLYRDASILLLDEPTAVLTPGESEDLFRVMRELARQGRAIVFISHKLGEVLAVADRITVLRSGRVVGTRLPRETNANELAELMVGRPVILRIEKRPSQPGEAILAVEGLRVADDRGVVAVEGMSFAVRSGEICGIAGIEGNGQTELIEALTGLRLPISGQVTIDGRPVTGRGARRLFESGLAHIPEDRHRYGLVLDYSVGENLVLSSFYRSPFASGIALAWDVIRRFARGLIETFDIRTPSIDTRARSLSGGNQQKAVVAREMSRDPRILIAAQPTRGLDIGSIEFIHQRIVAARDGGAAVLLVSAELDEILALSDRIIVMYRGRVVADRPAGDYGRAEIGLLMAGGGSPGGGRPIMDPTAP